MTGAALMCFTRFCSENQEWPASGGLRALPLTIPVGVGEPLHPGKVLFYK